MKFNYKLSRNENINAWQEHSFTAPHTQTSELSASEKAWLLKLNETLTQLEDKYLPILDAKYTELQARVCARWLIRNQGKRKIHITDCAMTCRT